MRKYKLPLDLNSHCLDGPPLSQNAFWRGWFGQTRHFFDFEFEGASQDNQPSFIPHFKLGVFSGGSTPHSSDIMNLLHSIERKIFHILNQLEYHFQPGLGLDFVPETGLQPG